MSTKIKKFALILLAVVSSCNGKGPNKEVKLSGINGEAYYHLDHNSGEVVLAFKKEYAIPGDYYLTLSRDSLQLNEEFEAHFDIFHENYKIIIEEPTKYTISGTYKAPLPGVTRESDKYTYKASKQGVFDFRGRIEYDTVVVPFEYKFIVLPRLW